MNEKLLAAKSLFAVLDGALELEQIENLLEKPKSSEMGDIAFPAFSLAKTLRKAPQIIAGEIAENIDATGFDKVVATGPYVNFFLDKKLLPQQLSTKLSLKKKTMATKISVMVLMFLLTCRLQILPSLFLLVICAQLLSETRFQNL